MVQKSQPQEDLRVRRTRKMLQQALIELTIEKKGFSDVTIQDITERAMVNRSTFYRHYLDKCDLLSQYMNEVSALVSDESFMAEKMGLTDSPSRLIYLLNHIQSFADFYRVILGAKGDPGFTEDFRKMTEKRFRYLLTHELVEDNPNAPPVDLRISYVTYAGIGVIVWWLENDQPCTVEELARWLGTLSSNSIGLSLKQNMHGTNNDSKNADFDALRLKHNN
ncbi:MAG: TetR/AcrR family transcriptional regulator [Chitinophagaceae bacterium]|nr:TetR/AcrR family transcriptional regulator [Anaerolineae bacterium]